MQTVKLIIDTGNGNIAVAADSGRIDPNWQSLINIAFQGQAIVDFNNTSSSKMTGYLDTAITSLRNDRQSYASLTPTELALRPKLLEFLTNWREDCREHSSTNVSIEP
jgi:hypothetical protein